MPKGPGVAVLPFVNLSGDANQEYFSDGLTEDILTELARTRDLRVLARNTTFQYKGKAVDVSKLGHELGVRYVLEGSVRRAGDDLRVTAQLIDAETGAHIWADKFDRKMADIFLVQDEIVGQIVAKIAGGFGASKKPRSSRQRARAPTKFSPTTLFFARTIGCISGRMRAFAKRENSCARRSPSIPRARGRAGRSPGSRSSG